MIVFGRIVLGAAILLLLLCVWILIPPAGGTQIIATVAAIELSPYVLAVSLLLLACVVWVRPAGFLIGAIVLCANIACCAVPVLALWMSPAGRTPRVAFPVFPVTITSIPVQLGGTPHRIRAYLPQTPAAAPIVFAMYGGAWQRGDPSVDAALNASIARTGIAVFALDYRHAPRYRFPLPLEDVQEQITMILRDAARYHADARRFALVGHSSGGQLAELAAFAPGSKARALVSYSGAIDLAKGYEMPPRPDPIDIKSVIAGYLGGPPQGNEEAYRAASPIFHIRAALAPALLIYGTRDHVVDIRYARKFRDDLRARGNHVELLELPWTEHAFEYVPYGLHAPVAQRATLAFLHAHL